MKQKWIWVPICVIVLAVLLFVGWTNSKSSVISHVQRNLDTLETYAKSCAERPEDYVNYNGWNTGYRAHYGVVTFQVSYLGFGSQADEKGFYYAPNGSPRTFGCDVKQTETENGIRFLGEGDNYVDTEQIAPNWFWFEQHW